jgi:hypothetical protein
MEGLTALKGVNHEASPTAASSIMSNRSYDGINGMASSRQEDPFLGLLDGLYKAVVVDSGLRDFLVGEWCASLRGNIYCGSVKL